MPTMTPVQKTLSEAIADSRPNMLRQARRMLRGSDGAEDATQDALLAALHHIDCFRGDSQLGTWLYRVGANAVLMSLRRQRRSGDRTQRALASLPADGCWLNGSRASSQPHAQLEEAQNAELLRWAIAKLPERYRAVIEQCDLAEKPIETVAATLGITIGGVRTRRLRAHRMLRTTLRGRGDL